MKAISEKQRSREGRGLCDPPKVTPGIPALGQQKPEGGEFKASPGCIVIQISTFLILWGKCEFCVLINTLLACSLWKIHLLIPHQCHSPALDSAKGGRWPCRHCVALLAGCVCILSLPVCCLGFPVTGISNVSSIAAMTSIMANPDRVLMGCWVLHTLITYKSTQAMWQLHELHVIITALQVKARDRQVLNNVLPLITDKIRESTSGGLVQDSSRLCSVSSPVMRWLH